MNTKLQVTVQGETEAKSYEGTSLTYFEDYVLLLDGSNKVKEIQPEEIIKVTLFHY